MKRKKGKTQKSRKDDFVVELELPVGLLEFCGNLEDKQCEENIQAEVCKEQVEDISISVNREDNKLKFLLKGLEDFPIHFVENRWCCNVRSVRLPRSRAEDATQIFEKESEVVPETECHPEVSVCEPAAEPADTLNKDEGMVLNTTQEEQEVAKTAAESEAENCRRVSKRQQAKETKEDSTPNESAKSKHAVNEKEAPSKVSKDKIEEFTPRRTSRIIKVKRWDDELTPLSSRMKKVEEQATSKNKDILVVPSRIKKVNEADKPKSKDQSVSKEKELVVCVTKVKKEKEDSELEPVTASNSFRGKASGDAEKIQKDSTDGTASPSLDVTRSGRVRRPKRQYDDDPDYDPTATESKKKRPEPVETPPAQPSTPTVQATTSVVKGGRPKTICIEIKNSPGPVKVQLKENKEGEDLPKGEYKCFICGGQFNTRSGLTRHQNRIHENVTSEKTGEEESVIEADKEESTPDKVKVKKEVISELQTQTFYCPECSLIYQERKSLIKHVKSVHCTADNYEDILAKTEAQFFKTYKKFKSKSEELVANKCPLCGEERTGRSILKHMTLCHKDHSDFTNIFTEMKKEYMEQHSKVRKLMKREYETKKKDESYMCQYCGRQFDFRPSRVNHEKFRCESNPNKRKLHECQLCGFATTDENKFKEHKNNHGENDRVHCPLCQKSYKTRAGLTVHKRKAHRICKKVPLLPHVCPVCKRVFYDKDHLKKHLVTHSDAMPFQCELCGRQFKTKGAVQKHQKMFHFNRYKFHCEKCGHGVEKATYLAKHRCGNIRRRQSGENINIKPFKSHRSQTGGSRRSKKVEIVRMMTEEEAGIKGIPLTVFSQDAEQETQQAGTEMIMQFTTDPVIEEAEEDKVKVESMSSQVAEHDYEVSGAVPVREYDPLQQEELHEYAVPIQYETSDGDTRTVLQVLPEGAADPSLYTTLQALDHNQHLIPVSNTGAIQILTQTGPGGELYTMQPSSGTGTEVYPSEGHSQHVQIQYISTDNQQDSKDDVMSNVPQSQPPPPPADISTPQKQQVYQKQHVYQIMAPSGDALSSGKHGWVPGQTIQTPDGQQMTVVFTSQEADEFQDKSMETKPLASVRDTPTAGAVSMATEGPVTMDSQEEVVEEVVVAAETDYVIHYV